MIETPGRILVGPLTEPLSPGLGLIRDPLRKFWSTMSFAVVSSPRTRSIALKGEPGVGQPGALSRVVQV